MADQLNNAIYNRPPENKEVEIDLVQIARIILKKLWVIILGGIVGGIIALAVTLFLIDPTYRSSFTAYVNNRTASNQSTEMISSGDTSAAQQLTHTYAAIMTSRPVVEQAIEKAGLDYRYESVHNAISTSITSSTALITVNVTLTSAQDAQSLAQALAEVSPDYVSGIVEGSSMKVVSYPVIPSGQYAPSPKRNTAMGVLIGLVIMIALVVIRALTDTRIKSEKELEEEFGIRVIGTIPNFREAGHEKGGGYSHYKAKKQ